MSWTSDEWDGFCLCLERWWKDDLDETDRVAWKLAVDDVEPVVAVAALKQLLRRGATWRPSVAAFMAVLEPAVPTFDEAWPVICRAMGSLRPGEDGSRVVGLVSASAGDHAAGWLASYGVWRLAGEPVNDPAFGGAVVKRLGESYAEMTAEPRVRDRLLTALEVGELRRIDPLKALEGGS